MNNNTFRLEFDLESYDSYVLTFIIHFIYNDTNKVSLKFAYSKGNTILISNVKSGKEQIEEFFKGNNIEGLINFVRQNEDIK